jgi:hypothetical protein
MQDHAWTFARAAAGAIGLFLTLSTPAFAATEPGHVQFEVMREGHSFGRQGVTVSMRNGELVAETSATLHAGLGPVTLFTYTQRCSESWRAGALTSLQCATRQNGHAKTVQGRLADGSLRMNGTAGSIVFSPDTLPTSWWTRPPLSTREMINSETGARLPVRVTMIGRETIVANGVRIPADHIRVQGTLAVDLWYDDEGHWVGCAFTAQGQRMTYRLLTSPAQGPS